MTRPCAGPCSHAGSELPVAPLAAGLVAVGSPLEVDSSVSLELRDWPGCLCQTSTPRRRASGRDRTEPSCRSLFLNGESDLAGFWASIRAQGATRQGMLNAEAKCDLLLEHESKPAV